MRHILIVGRNGVGKSTLIRSLLEIVNIPVYGVITKKEPPRTDGYAPVFIHLYGEERTYSDDNCIGICREGSSIAYPEVFDRFSMKMQFPNEGVIVLDELGFMESRAERFTGAVLRILDKAPFVIAAVRDKDTPFLNAVRNHPCADVYHIDELNRDELRENLRNRLSVDPELQ